MYGRWEGWEGGQGGGEGGLIGRSVRGVLSTLYWKCHAHQTDKQTNSGFCANKTYIWPEFSGWIW